VDVEALLHQGQLSREGRTFSYVEASGSRREGRGEKGIRREKKTRKERLSQEVKKKRKKKKRKGGGEEIEREASPPTRKMGTANYLGGETFLLKDEEERKRKNHLIRRKKGRCLRGKEEKRRRSKGHWGGTRRGDTILRRGIGSEWIVMGKTREEKDDRRVLFGAEYLDILQRVSWTHRFEASYPASGGRTSRIKGEKKKGSPKGIQRKTRVGKVSA